MVKVAPSPDQEIFKELLAAIKAQGKKVNMDRVKRAYLFAKKAHEGQFRMSGIPYICHPLETSKILAELGADEETIITGILHDVPEDTERTVEDIAHAFGGTIAKLVDALTKLSKVQYKHSMGERQIQSLRKIFVETAKDPRVVIVKLADRLHNMKTIHYLRPDKQQRIAKETLEIFAPLANVYGIYQLRRQLEDLSFMVLQPEEYTRIEAFVHDHEQSRSGFIQNTLKIFKKQLKRAGINAEMDGRPKHFYSIYEKMVRDQKDLSDIYDYFAIRVIVDNVDECYRVLGVAHNLFKPKAQRFKDYISLPKANGYQSLHTTVVGLHGKLTEIQIRTHDMHINAEYGAAAHLYYKIAQTSQLKESLELLKKYDYQEQFLRSLHEDVLQDRIHVFSPKGDVIHLPEGSTCLDYIYGVDLPVNKKISRVVVNNRTYSLMGELQSGDRVEVMYSDKEQAGPERWWLGHVKTAKAKEAITAHFEQESFETRVHIGESLLQQALDHESQGLVYQLPEKKIRALLEHFGVEHFDDILAEIGAGHYEADDVYRLLFPNLEAGLWNNLRRFVHSVRKKFWQDEPKDYKYSIRIVVEAYDRVGLLKEIIQPFYELKLPIIRAWAHGHDLRDANGMRFLPGTKLTANHGYLSRQWFDIYLDRYEQLITLFDRLEKIPGMVRVQRVFYRNQVIFGVAVCVTTIYFLMNPFLLMFLKHSVPLESTWLTDVAVYAGLSGVFLLLMWLRSLGNKTFPHFEETRYFWPVSYGLTTLAVSSIFVNNAVFDLDLDLFYVGIFSVLIFVFLYFSYRSHERRRKRHLSRLKEHQIRQARVEEK